MVKYSFTAVQNKHSQSLNHAAYSKFMRLFLTILFLVVSLSTSLAAKRAAWQADWEQTIKAAENEGAVTIYSSITPKIVIDAGVFQKRFPRIKVTSVTSGGGGLIQRITTERRADKYLADIVIGGGEHSLELVFRQDARSYKASIGLAGDYR